MDEGRKRVILIAASILIARHLKNPEDLHDSRPSPRTESLIASAIQWADVFCEGLTAIGDAFGYPPFVEFLASSRWLDVNS
jgi:hypothetical protein